MRVGAAWGLILIAGILETIWAIGLKYSHGFSRPLPTAITLTAMVVSMWLLAQALKVLPAGTGYAVWTGIGVVGTAVLGMVLLGESRAPARILCLLMIVAGILGLRLLGSSAQG